MPTNGRPFENFGNAIAISNGSIAVGALGNDTNGSGSADLFDVNPLKSCLDLNIESLRAGAPAICTITNGTPGAKSVTVFGSEIGQTGFDN